jgi:hypothetical protein
VAERWKIPRDENVQKPTRTSQAIVALSVNFHRASKRNPGIRRHTWIKPAEDYVRLNIDAAFSAERFSGPTGAVVIRDDQGMFLAGRCSGIPHVVDAATNLTM